MHYTTLHSGNSMREYTRNITSNYATNAREGYNELFKPYPTKTYNDIIEEVSKFINQKTLYLILSNLVYGHVIPELKKIDDIRLQKWVSNYGVDSAESTIPVKFGPGQSSVKFRLNASNNHITCGFGYQLWYTRCLEKGGEGYDIILRDQLGSCIARNMQLVDKCSDFSIKLNLDTATQCNIENVRNCLMEGICKSLKITQFEIDNGYCNDNGCMFWLQDFRISVSQETQHIMIRLAKAGAFKKKCRDYNFIRLGFQEITNAAHLKWDETKSPPIINKCRFGPFGTKVSEIQLDPYKLYDQCNYLKDDAIFSEIQRFVLALWQSVKTTDPKLNAELLRKQKSDKFSRKQFKQILTYLVQSTPPRFQLAFFSVCLT